MSEGLPPDLRDLRDQLDASERDAARLVEGLSEHEGTRRRADGGWSIAECLDHLATSNRVYLSAMQEAARRADPVRQRRRGPARPGVLGGLFVRLMEPPAGRLGKLRAPEQIRPRAAPPLGETFDRFMASQGDVRAFVEKYAGLDLARVRFKNPFVWWIRFSLATGLHVIAAHDRRHLLQAWGVRREIERWGVRQQEPVAR